MDERMDERIWTDTPLQEGERLAKPDCEITRVATGHQSLISGQLDAALRLLAPDIPEAGFGGRADPAETAIRIARDRMLLVTRAPLPQPAGWHAAGFAVSRAGALYAPLRFSGTCAWDMLAHGLISPPPHGSRSAALHVAGISALVTGPAEGRADGLTLWVPQAHLTYLTSFLRQLPPA
ncbi:hypothetical protein [Primorskyibacter sp. S187A]|uniref:hypothetical protein n=1 Tax=Primorskyibacter sp. S187A TaxID=3415130 RepID=UPI003C7BA8EB